MQGTYQCAFALYGVGLVAGTSYVTFCFLGQNLLVPKMT